MKFLIYTLISICLFTACKKANENPEPVIDAKTGETIKSGSFTILFESRFQNQPFALEKDYVNAKGETFRINILKYYLGNFKLRRPDGTNLSVGNYFLITAPSSEKITFTNIPAGTYSGISFDIGVDSIHNVTRPQAGSALDPAVNPDMYWLWGSQYIFLFLEGSSPASKTSSNVVQYHIAGYKKAENAVQNISTEFGSLNMEVKQNAVPNIHYYVDIAEIFKNPVNLSIADYSSVQTSGSDAVMISNNYKDMFVMQHIEN